MYRPHLRSFSSLLISKNITTASTTRVVVRTPKATMTTAAFRYLDPNSFAPGSRPWSKVDVDYTNYSRTERRRSVTDFRDCIGLHSQQGSFGTDVDVAGFAVYHSPSAVTKSDFENDATVRGKYYDEVEQLLREKLASKGKIRKIVIFDHTIRKHDPSAPRQPVQQVHVDQTPKAAEVRVRRHVPDTKEAEELLKGRYQLINVWRPIGHPATDFPLAVIDWRTTEPEDLMPVDLLYPKRKPEEDDGDDRGKEVLPTKETLASTEGYEVKGETYGILPSEKHKFYYVKDMKPDEAMFIKCFDSWGDNEGKERLKGEEGMRKGIAALTPHTAFIDPQTPPGTKGRESIEVRCLVFYE
ncbi:putative acetylxylan esterase A [Podospora australis]|uniref:Acetylxylan esterase A n=1 Tax=Podospora australis TaxID=1536484 RepID=A0AAN7AEH0_9PEZI|nr:putative acetylxylan esterase A [Podospora australis]